MSQDLPSISDSLADALILAKIPPWGAGTVALAQRYAALLDEAAPARKYDKALRTLGAAVGLYAGDDASAVVEAFDAVRDALGQHSVASDLGPKLLATLAALNMTLQKATAPAKGNDSDGDGGPGDELAKLRASRRTRSHRASTVDPAAPAPDA